MLMAGPNKPCSGGTCNVVGEPAHHYPFPLHLLIYISSRAGRSCNLSDLLDACPLSLLADRPSLPPPSPLKLVLSAS